MLASESRHKGVFQKSEIAQGLCRYNYTVIHKKRGNALVIITLENLDGVEYFFTLSGNSNECPLQISNLLNLFYT